MLHFQLIYICVDMRQYVLLITMFYFLTYPPKSFLILSFPVWQFHSPSQLGSPSSNSLSLSLWKNPINLSQWF